jgi:tRNA threonylcarbamoyladenosine biosynthesis protein TsaB
VLLAVDTSTKWVSLALYDGIFIHYEKTWQSQFHHTVELAPAIDDLFAHAGVVMTDLTGLAVAIGPGSFTSLRIGLAAVKGLSLGLNIPVVGVPSLDVIAYAQPVDEKPMIAVLQAGRHRLAFVPYQAESGRWVAQAAPEVIDAQDLVKSIEVPTWVCGELSAEARSTIGRRWKNALIVSPAKAIRRAGYLAEIGWQRLMDNQTDDPITLVPIYLSTADIPSV